MLWPTNSQQQSADLSRPVMVDAEQVIAADPVSRLKTRSERDNYHMKHHFSLAAMF